MTAEVNREEAAEIMRADIVPLLSKDPHSPLANWLGQKLMEHLED